EGVPAELTGTGTAGAGETGLSIRGGSRVTKSTKDSKKSKIRLLIMHQLIWGFVMMSVNEGSVLGSVATASAHRNIGALENINIVLAASTRVRFCLSTTPFCCGVLRNIFW
ncbi:hypothetical protein Tco_1095835, partial [Tanacetum coccineum]